MLAPVGGVDGVDAAVEKDLVATGIEQGFEPGEVRVARELVERDQDVGGVGQRQVLVVAGDGDEVDRPFVRVECASAGLDAINHGRGWRRAP
jgi:hypothetical protein